MSFMNRAARVGVVGLLARGALRSLSVPGLDLLEAESGQSGRWLKSAGTGADLIKVLRSLIGKHTQRFRLLCAAVAVFKLRAPFLR